MNSQPDHSILIHTRPGLVKMVWRGLRKRCAWCGGKRAFFTGFFKKGERCNTCGLNWQRNLEGFELGAAAMGVFLTFGPIIVWMVAALLLGVNFVPLLIVAAALAVFVPILTYPLTYTVWFGVYLFMNEPEPVELDDAIRWRETNANA
jgi:uncharacterized protein (DUF983 family)